MEMETHFENQPEKPSLAPSIALWALGASQTHPLVPSFVGWACLLQAWADPPGLIWASLECNRLRQRACLAGA